MTKALSKQVYVVLLQSGVRYHIDERGFSKLSAFLRDQTAGPTDMINLQGNMVKKMSIEGVFTPQEMEEADRRKRGEWKCQYDGWHKKYENCECGRSMKINKPEDHPAARENAHNKRTRKESLKVMAKAAYEAKKAEIAKHGVSPWSTPVESFIGPMIKKLDMVDESQGHLCQSTDWVKQPDGGHKCQVCGNLYSKKS